jgi:hypothetical protein
MHDHSEVIINEMVNNVDFFGKIFSLLINRLSGNPKELKMMAKADVVINNKMARTEYSGIASVNNYVSYAR